MNFPGLPLDKDYMSLGIISSASIFAAPRTSPDFTKAGKVADECMDILQTGETTAECFETLQREMKNAPRKSKEAVVTIIYFRLRQKYPYIGGIVYLDEVRDDLLKRIRSKDSKASPDPGVRLIRFTDIYVRAYQCVDRRYANLDPDKCMELIKTRPLDRSPMAQLHVIRMVEDFSKKIMKPDFWHEFFYPRIIRTFIYNVIGDSI